MIPESARAVPPKDGPHKINPQGRDADALRIAALADTRLASQGGE